MNDWRQIEATVVEFFRQRGYRPVLPTGQALFAGDWIVKHGNKPINLSDLARVLSFDAQPSALRGDR